MLLIFDGSLGSIYFLIIFQVIKIFCNPKKTNVISLEFRIRESQLGKTLVKWDHFCLLNFLNEFN